jgi:hypothetical protein|mmetsp:Transcript_58026/g.96086  ORF Transcript_58026/g.96086 Transcript_58026/m.96086 type:complete len:206 (+) Transcript_58026:248-865(+)
MVASLHMSSACVRPAGQVHISSVAVPIPPSPNRKCCSRCRAGQFRKGQRGQQRSQPDHTCVFATVPACFWHCLKLQLLPGGAAMVRACAPMSFLGGRVFCDCLFQGDLVKTVLPHFVVLGEPGLCHHPLAVVDPAVQLRGPCPTALLCAKVFAVLRLRYALATRSGGCVPRRASVGRALGPRPHSLSVCGQRGYVQSAVQRLTNW